jgi:hypothetical protein
MTRAEQFVDSFKRRNLTISRHPRGGFLITPPGAVTAADRAELKDIAGDLERLLTERERQLKLDREVQGLKPADQLVLRAAQKELDGRLVGFRRRRSPSNGPPLEPSLPPATVESVAAIESKEFQKHQSPEVEQMPLSLGDQRTGESASSEQRAVPEPEPAATARICSSCSRLCDDPLIIHCQNCDALLPDELVERSTQDETVLSQSNPSSEEVTSLSPKVMSADEPTSLSPELIVNDEPSTVDLPERSQAEVSGETDDNVEPELASRATSPSRELVLVEDHNDDLKHDDIVDYVPLHEPVEVSAPRPVSAPHRAQRILLWVSARLVRSRRSGRLLVELKVRPSPSTCINGAHRVRVSFETRREAHRYELLKETTELGHEGFVALSPGALRMGIEWWR